ncbi:MAG: HAMP domain-containing histidine kinase [Variovorax sp.]|nr:MAG: HAMP domain-containing histidine kinase [Variovorax sp.]
MAGSPIDKPFALKDNERSSQLPRVGMFITPVPKSRTAADRQRVVGCELLRQFMRESRYRHLGIVAMKAAIVTFCLGYVSLTWLLSWFVAGVAVIFLRLSIERQYTHDGAFDTMEAQDTFVRKLKPVYALHAGLWGISTLFYFDRLPITNQYACGLIMACVAALPLRSAALVPSLLRLFMNTLFLVILTCLLVATMTSFGNAQGMTTSSGPEWISQHLFVVVPIAQWALLRSVAERVHANQRRQYEFQFDLVTKEEQARALAESKIRFLAAAAHDLRQPVMALSIYADQLLEQPEEHQMLAPRIARASSAVVHLFDSLFDLANLDSGKVILRIEPVPLQELLNDLIHQFESVARSKSISLQVQAVDAVISTDVVRFRRMVGNVVSNAIKYSPPASAVRLVASHAAGALRIDVIDQGIGIPDADRERVFEEFYRVSRHDAETQEGVGLGLSIVARLARLLGCEIRFASVVGEGTQFSFFMAHGEDRQQGPQTSFGVG